MKKSVANEKMTAKTSVSDEDSDARVIQQRIAVERRAIRPCQCATSVG